jgi:hypothetical protein
MQIHRNPPPALSKDFASATIATLAEMKEWKGVLGTMVTFGLVVDGSWAQIYHERVQTSLEQATVAASTNSDHDALQLLRTQFANLAKWESVVVAERRNHNGARTVAPNSLQNDPVLTTFSNCGKFLTTMLGNGIFTDNPSCGIGKPGRGAASLHNLLRSSRRAGESSRSFPVSMASRQSTLLAIARRRFLPRVRRLAAA